jgi:hypothetical protein
VLSILRVRAQFSPFYTLPQVREVALHHPTSGLAASSHLFPLRKVKASFTFPFTRGSFLCLFDPFYNLVAQPVGGYTNGGDG